MNFPVDEIVQKLADEIERRNTLYVTERQIIRRAGWGIQSGRQLLRQMRDDPKFPPKDISGKRYWPSVVDFLDYWNKRPVAHPVEAPPQRPYRGRAGYNLAAAEERVGRRMAEAAGISPDGISTIEEAKHRIRMAERQRPAPEAAKAKLRSEQPDDAKDE